MNNKKTIKTILFASLIAAMILPFSGMDFAEAKQVDDKSLVKEKIKDKMNQQADKDNIEKNTNTKFTSEEYGIPYNLIFEDNGKLVVGIDADKAKEFNKKYSKENVKADLNTNVDLDVRYFEFERESSVRAGDALTYGSNAATITVVKNNKIVTTGHAFSLNNVVNAGLVGGTPCQEVKITEDNNYSGAYADAAYGIDTVVSGCDNDYVNDSLRFNGNTYSVTYGVASDITLNKFIRIAGIQTTSSGYILDTDVTTRDPDYGVLNDQVVGSYSSTGGDSGAPIFSLTSGTTVKLLGQHVGRACEVDLNSGTNFGYWCDANGEGGLKYFSPWDQVASHLGI
jgi:hypothetical protein